MNPEGPDLRARLLESALAIVDADGAAGLTVRAVAKAAGCSTMGVYTHFKGKSGLIDAVVEWGFGELNTAMADGFDGAGRGRDGLVAGAEAYRAWALAYPTQYQTMLVPSNPSYEPSAATRLRSWDAFSAHRSRVAEALGGPDADPECWQVASAQLWATVHGHVMIELLREAYAPERAPLCEFRTVVEAAVAALAKNECHAA